MGSALAGMLQACIIHVLNIKIIFCKFYISNYNRTFFYNIRKHYPQTADPRGTNKTISKQSNAQCMSNLEWCLLELRHFR